MSYGARLPLNVWHDCTVPPSNPLLNHCSLCALEPCVQLSGLTARPDIFSR